MNKKSLRFSFNRVIGAASRNKCADLHHKRSQHHEINEVCPVEYEIQRHVEVIKQHMKDIGL